MLYNPISTTEVLQTIYNQSMEQSRVWLDSNYSSFVSFLDDVKNPFKIQKQLELLGFFGKTQIYQMEKIQNWVSKVENLAIINFEAGCIGEYETLTEISQLSLLWEDFLIEESEKQTEDNKKAKLDFGLSNFFETLNITL